MSKFLFLMFQGMTVSRLPSIQAMKATPGGQTGKIKSWGMVDDNGV